MRKPKFILVVLLICMMSCDSDDYRSAGIPSVILNEFQTDFPDASEIDWAEQKSSFEVEFDMDDKQHAVLLDSAGNIIKHKYEIRLTDLPEAIKNHLGNDYGDAVFDEIELLKMDNKTFYQFEIEQMFFDKEVVIDQSGKIVKELPFWE